TDSMEMGAISTAYPADEATIMAVEAGCDIILCPADFEKAYKGLMKAVKSGRITEERINESVLRILRLKLKYRYEYE
ncbi:MAG: glycoside hydrolase family 3 protein, partial [Firmicutes bacterium]|nr:glycoside hydrolase family 3 protein [Bacillota bacterium]